MRTKLKRILYLGLTLISLYSTNVSAQTTTPLALPESNKSSYIVTSPKTPQKIEVPFILGDYKGNFDSQLTPEHGISRASLKVDFNPLLSVNLIGTNIGQQSQKTEFGVENTIKKIKLEGKVSFNDIFQLTDLTLTAKNSFIEAFYRNAFLNTISQKDICQFTLTPTKGLSIKYGIQKSENTLQSDFWEANLTRDNAFLSLAQTSDSQYFKGAVSSGNFALIAGYNQQQEEDNLSLALTYKTKTPVTKNSGIINSEIFKTNGIIASQGLKIPETKQGGFTVEYISLSNTFKATYNALTAEVKDISASVELGGEHNLETGEFKETCSAKSKIGPFGIAGAIRMEANQANIGFTAKLETKF